MFTFKLNSATAAIIALFAMFVCASDLHAGVMTTVQPDETLVLTDVSGPESVPEYNDNSSNACNSLDAVGGVVDGPIAMFAVTARIRTESSDIFISMHVCAEGFAPPLELLRPA